MVKEIQVLKKEISRLRVYAHKDDDLCTLGSTKSEMSFVEEEAKKQK